ncbi:nuclear transport factor 2 family protein [Chitinophaga sp. sic0106]|uniref:nuclear transport factor 2 family protein n=1 Tax=Chitinophaga sp. sic0106 TaxID=2854785 RepID=UPI001C46083A|nr:nuclear transport factor 2 family protein [Chitinophaga sp. sic0106]MBV7532876.1 nuclear transport factor 2 family protein [Chitinophaga sp. sic0106]
MRTYITFLLVLFASISSAAQLPGKYVTPVVLRLDSLFWQAYNTCDIERFRGLLADDVEFYHDKGGSLTGMDPLANSIKQNLCSNRDKYKLRREAIPATVKVFLLENNHEVYGALITGMHIFYVTEGAKPEYADGKARFEMLWLLKDGQWKVSRVFSYDHGPAQDN